jgi:hypothetical protein
MMELSAVGTANVAMISLPLGMLFREQVGQNSGSKHTNGRLSIDRCCNRCDIPLCTESGHLVCHLELE